MAVEEARARLRRQLEETYGVEGAAIAAALFHARRPRSAMTPRAAGLLGAQGDAPYDGWLELLGAPRLIALGLKCIADRPVREAVGSELGYPFHDLGFVGVGDELGPFGSAPVGSPSPT